MVRGIPTFPSTEALTEELGVQQQSNPHLQTLFKLPVSAKIGRSYKPRFFRYLKTQISRDRVTASVHFTSGRPCRGQSRHGTTYLTPSESTNQLSLVYQSKAKWSVDPPPYNLSLRHSLPTHQSFQTMIVSKCRLKAGEMKTRGPSQIFTPTFLGRLELFRFTLAPHDPTTRYKDPRR